MHRMPLHASQPCAVHSKVRGYTLIVMRFMKRCGGVVQSPCLQSVSGHAIYSTLEQKMHLFHPLKVFFNNSTFFCVKLVTNVKL